MSFRKAAAVAALAAALATAAVPRAEAQAELPPVAFTDLPGWAQDDHAAAYQAFLVSCRTLIAGTPPLRAALPPPPELRPVCDRAVASPDRDTAEARRFFETEFEPRRAGRGVLTGYYEPEIRGALAPDATFDTPLMSRPDDLETLEDGESRPGLPKEFTAARRTPDGFAPYPTRAEIEDGAIAGRTRPLVWLTRVDAFFVHVQGSTRVRLPDGRVLRLAYDGRNGWPFTAIGRKLVERGVMLKEVATMQALRAWLAARPDEGRALMRENQSYIFFRIDDALRPKDGPRGAQAAPLTAGRSLAVDRTRWSYGLPFFIDGRLPSTVGGGRLRRLTIAQDTGSAILGQARGDYFAGSGDEAGRLAGGMREQTDFVVLLPRGAARPAP